MPPEISPEAPATSRGAGNRLDRLVQPGHRGVEVVLDLPVGVAEAVVQPEREVAIGQGLEPLTQQLDHAGRLLGRLGALVRGARLRVGLGLLPPQGFVGFHPRLLRNFRLEAFDRRRDLADLVLAAKAWQDHIEIAGCEATHGAHHAFQRTSDAARGQQ